MKGTIRWMQVNPDTNEFMYDLGIADFNTNEMSVREKLIVLLLHKWKDFGDDGDCIVIKEEE